MNDGDKIECKELRLMNDDSAGMYENVNYLGSIMEKDSFEKVFEFLMNAADCCDEIVLDFSLIDDTVECLTDAAQAFLNCSNPAQFVSRVTFIICAPEVNINDWASTDIAAAHVTAQQNHRYIYEFVHVQTGVILKMTIKCERDNKLRKSFIKNT
uniref:Uncharacterized protein n=1 Tax=Ditylenchus dipsaci TaxID=166011 RepID=A0A915E9Z2_9BILA